jgi:hypothetical protein
MLNKIYDIITNKYVKIAAIIIAIAGVALSVFIDLGIIRII